MFNENTSMKSLFALGSFLLVTLAIKAQCEPIAVCENITLGLNDSGEGTILDTDLDGGSELTCGTGPLSFSASQTVFDCEDIFSGPIPPSLIISGAYDGPLPGGLPKGIELYVVNDISDLSIYGLGSANNGGGTDGQEFTFPAVSATTGSYIYVASDSVRFEEWFDFFPNYTAGAMVINGDDAIELFKDGEVSDVFGEIDMDGTGTLWEYLDGWAYRVSNTGPDGDIFDIDNWMFSGTNVFDGELTNATAATPIPIGTFTTAPTIGVPVTLTVTDADMNTAECIANVFLIDTLAPVMSCIGEEVSTFSLDETGSFTLAISDVDDGTVDGCEISEMSLSKTDFTCADAGLNEIFLFATDVNGNVDSCKTTIIIDDSEVIGVSLESFENISCFGEGDGSVDISTLGGTGMLSYDWDDESGDFATTENLEDLEEGTYTLTVTDEVGCSSKLEVLINEPNEIDISGVITDAMCSGVEEGEIDITVTGGTGDYTYDWDDESGDFATTEDLTDLFTGTYTILVTDENGCEEERDFIIENENPIDLTILPTEPGGGLIAQQDSADYQWLTCPGLTPIDGATEQTFIPTEGGEYAVMIINDSGCVETSECIPFGFDAIDELEGIEVTIYPNPSNGLVNLTFSTLNLTDLTIVVRDIKGSVLLKRKALNTSEELDLQALENGVYFIQIKTLTANITRKITINK